MDLHNPNSPQVPIRELAIRYHQEGRFVEAMKAYRVAILLFPKDTVLSYNLGNLFRQIDQPQKAIACYELVLRLNPEDLPSLMNLAPLYRSGGYREKAIACYQKILELRPDNETARYFLDALLGQTPERSPDSYISELFDRYAPTFDKHITQALQYQAPQILRELLQDCPSVPKFFHNAIDLGCGTGLGAQALQTVSSHWEGVDLSAEMLHKAAEKNIYKVLHHQEILQFLKAPAEKKHALVLMADVVPYFGELTPLFRSLQARLLPGSCLLFTTEVGDHGIELHTSGRYRHSFPAVKTQAEQAGFFLSAHRQGYSRMQAGIPVQASYYILKLEPLNVAPQGPSR